MKKLFLILLFVKSLFGQLYTIHLLTENSPEILAEYLVKYNKNYQNFYILQYGPSLYGLYAYVSDDKLKLNKILYSNFINNFPSAIIEKTDKYTLQNYKVMILPFIYQAKLKNYKEIKTIYIPFKLGKYNLSKKAKDKLKSLIKNNKNILVVISTQADSVPIRYAKAKDNMDLSLKRAKVIKQFILKVKNEK